MTLRFSAGDYVRDVLSGEQMACEWVKLACGRHREDLRTGGERGLYFDEGAAMAAVAFFGLLRHWKGEWAGQVVALEPWQQFVVWSLFGWKRVDGTRRFRTAYLEVARKNGKTTMAAGIGLYLMIADGEPGAEVYTAAVKRDQARIAHHDAKKFVQASAAIGKQVDVFKDNLHDLRSSSKFEPLGKDADSTHGLNVHGVIADELHAWKDGELWDVLETATGSRRQPLMLSITTAGFDRQSLCYQQHTYTEQVLNGSIVDDSWFGIIFTLDEGDLETNPKTNRAPWQDDERLWLKANPNLGISKKVDDMRRKARRAEQMPARLNAFLRLELNIWTQAETRWVNRAFWDLCAARAVDEEALAGRRCYGGLDLSSNTDVTAWVLVFPPEQKEGTFEVLCRFFIPADNMHERVRKDKVMYDVWERQGWLTATEGNVVDTDFVLAQVAEDKARFGIQELAFDRWGAKDVTTRLQNEVGFTVDEKTHQLSGAPLLVQFGQGFASMNGPMKDLERLILGARLATGGNPVLTWMADNLVVREDPAGNVKPDKEKSTEKIDGMVALVMALGRAMVHVGKKKSVYDERGILEIGE